MNALSPEKSIRRRRLLRMNILIAFVVFLGSFFMIITSEYSSLAERKAADAVYNALAIGSLIYMAFVWITCVMTKPFWFSSNKDH